MPRLYKGAFSGGVWSSGLWGRVDLDRYQAALRVGRNVIPLPEGGLIKRPGFEFVGYAPGATARSGQFGARLVPFKFNNDQTYVLVVEKDQIAIIENGAMIQQVLGVTLTGVTSGAQTQVDHSSGTALTAGTILYWRLGGFDEMEGRWVKVASSPAPTTTNFHVVDYMTGDDIDSSSWTDQGVPLLYEMYLIDGATSPDGWFDDGVGTPADPPPDELDYSQANDVIYFTHPDGPAKVVARGASGTAWTVTNFDPAPSQAAPSVSQSTYVDGNDPPAGTGSIDYAITAIETDEDTFEESLADLFTIDSLSTDDPLYVGPQDPGIDEDLLTATEPVRLEWSHVTGADRYRVYKAVSGIYGLIGTVEGTSGTLVYEDTGRVPNLSIAPPLEASYFGATDKYPGAVELFQQRIWFGRTNDLLRDVLASRSGSLSSFATSTVAVDDDPIVQTIVARSVQEVRYFVPLRNLVILTSDGEWGFDTGDAGALTPNSGLVSQSHWGARRVKPTIVGDSAIFVDRTGRSVRDLSYALENDGFSSSDISIFAKHFFEGREVVDMCYAQNPLQVLFCVMSDGRALTCTYVRDQQIFAWAEHDTGGYITSCCAINEDNQDNIYVIVQRFNSDGDDVMSVERMKTSYEQFVENSVHLDNGAYSLNALNAAHVFGSFRLQDGNFEVEIINTSGVSDEDLVCLALVQSPAHRLKGISVMVDSTGVSQTGVTSGYTRYRLYRHINGDVASREILDISKYLPDTGGPLGIANLNALTLAFNNPAQLHNLRGRDGLVTVRGDLTDYDAQTVGADGKITLAASHAAVHAGEPFTCEIETLDIDDPTNPITGAPVQIGDAFARFRRAVQYSIGRNRDALADVTLDDLDSLEDFNKQIGAFEGVSENVLFPSWERSGRIVIQDKSSFPLDLSAVIPRVEVGDLDG